MFGSMLRFQGAEATLYDSREQNPVHIKYFSSQAQTLRMLGTVRANVEVMWVDPVKAVLPGQVIKTTPPAPLQPVYYLVVKDEYDATIFPPIKTLRAINVLTFSTQLLGNSYAPAGPLDEFGDPAALIATPKTLRAIFDLSTDFYENSPGGSMPSGTLTILCAPGSGVAMNDEYTWNSKVWQVIQINPQWAAGQMFAFQVLMKEAERQTPQLT